MYGNKLTFLLERESLERIIRLIEVCDDLTKQLCYPKGDRWTDKIMAELDRTYRALGSTLANEHLGFYWLDEEKDGESQEEQP
ncbi:hypothetical protein [Parasutterella excrementihominis]|uniref:hypothetical protein n=1 Tax=Parasutterella excrementihominis TaxID=487175 RepID=UPI003AF01536